jgi:hypothetical protein
MNALSADPKRRPSAVVGAYRSNSGDADHLPTARALARRSDTPTLSSHPPAGGPLFTGSNTARADARAARLSSHGAAPALSPDAARAPAESGGMGYFGASAAAFDRRAKRYVDFSDGGRGGMGGGAPVFSGADGSAYERRMLRCVDQR